MKLKKLLFITSNRLGDAVLSTGLLDAAIKRFGPDTVTIACGPIPAPIFKGAPKLHEIILLNKQKKGMHWVRLWQKTVTQKWDVVIDIRNSLVSRLIPARAVYRFAHADRDLHKSAQLAAVLGLTEIPYNKIWLTPDVEAKASQLLPTGRPILALFPTANWGPKQWSADKFIEAARRLMFNTPQLSGGMIAVFGAANERDQSQPIIDALSHDIQVIDLVGKTDPLEAAACLQRATLCVGNDSGLMHIAAAMGVPTLGLFGPSNDREYAPHGPRTALVRAVAFHGLENTADPASLMQAISVDSVVEAAQKLL